MYGLVAHFDTPEALLDATKKAHAAGYRRMDTYTPLPVEGLADAMGRKGNAIPLIMLLGGISGGVIAYATQWFSAVIDYPYNVGGRPFHSWPSFIPITFEFTVLLSALSGVFGMFFLNGLPRLNHPIFNARGIERATVDGFFLCIESADPKWDPESTRRFLTDDLESSDVTEVWA